MFKQMTATQPLYICAVLSKKKKLRWAFDVGLAFSSNLHASFCYKLKFFHQQLECIYDVHACLKIESWDFK